MQRAALLVAVCLVALAPTLCSAQTPGRIVEVCVYQGQALVTREIEANVKPGPQEVLVTDLPERVIPGSLYATAGPNVSIRAVRFRSSATDIEPRQEVRELDAQIKLKERELKAIEAQVEALAGQMEFLSRIQEFAATKVNDEQNKGTLNPDALKATATFVFEQHELMVSKSIGLQTQQEDFQEELNLLQRKRSELTVETQKVAREGVIFLDAAQGGRAKMNLSYLVGSVGWSPAYSARLNKEQDKVSLEYHAALTQMSGEDWPGVKLTLSTSHPRMIASAPVLSPLRIALTPKDQQMDEGVPQEVTSYSDKTRALQQQLRGAQGTKGDVGQAGPSGPRGERASGGGMMGGPGMAYMPAQVEMPAAEEQFLAANMLAAELQNTELAAADDVVKLSRTIGATTTEGLAVDYPIEGQISIQSRQDQQMLPIAKVDLKATFSYTAVPLLTDYVYRMVECVNDTEFAFLAGPYNAYVDGAFAGRGDLPLTARGQGLAFGFGTETGLRASREFIEKTTTARGGNQIVQYKYRLGLSNFMGKPAKVRLWDRLPQSPNDQVSVQLTTTEPALSADPLYLAQQRPRGLLRWDVEVPANASGATAFGLDYQFQIEFDKNFDIGELPATSSDAMRKDMEMMMRLQSATMQ